MPLVLGLGVGFGFRVGEAGVVATVKIAYNVNATCMPFMQIAWD